MRSRATILLSKLLLLSLILLVAADALLTLSSPYWLKLLCSANPVDVTRGGEASISILLPPGSYPFMLFFVMASGAVLGALIWEGIRVLRNAHRGNPFSMKNAGALLRSAWLCLAQMVLFIAKLLNKLSLLTLGCAGMFLLAALLLFVLADLFHSAALLREDNDLTI